MTPARRRFLVGAGAAGLVWAFVGPSLGWFTRKAARPDPRPVQEAMASDMGAEYMELVKRAYHEGRSGDLQLLLAPFNSSNYTFESLTLVPQDPRTSHASSWMYLERIPLVVHAPGIVVASDSEERVTLADLAPTTAALIGADWPGDRLGTPLPIATSRSARKPKVVMTFVIDGGGWNVLDNFPDQWPNLRRLMGEGANFRNAIVGSFPAVTACAHASIGTGTFPSQHGITGHNIRDGKAPRKAYGTPGQADPGDILVPTLADLWSDQTDNRAWVGEIGYQVWHMGMLGYGGRNRPTDARPVGVYWAEDGSQRWEPHNPDFFRMPASVPGLDVLARIRRRLRGARLGRGVRAQAGQPPVALLQPADRALSGRPARGDLRLRADRPGRRDEPALHDLQVAGLHRPRVRHVLRAGQACSSRPSTPRSAGWSTSSRPASRASTY